MCHVLARASCVYFDSSLFLFSYQSIIFTYHCLTVLAYDSYFTAQGVLILLPTSGYRPHTHFHCLHSLLSQFDQQRLVFPQPSVIRTIAANFNRSWFPFAQSIFLFIHVAIYCFFPLFHQQHRLHWQQFCVAIAV